jgi:hypothetical protein
MIPVQQLLSQKSSALRRVALLGMAGGLPYVVSWERASFTGPAQKRKCCGFS